MDSDLFVSVIFKTIFNLFIYLFNLLIFFRPINYKQVLYTFGLLSSFSLAIDLFLEYLQEIK